MHRCTRGHRGRQPGFSTEAYYRSGCCMHRGEGTEADNWGSAPMPTTEGSALKTTSRVVDACTEACEGTDADNRGSAPRHTTEGSAPRPTTEVGRCTEAQEGTKARDRRHWDQ